MPKFHKIQRGSCLALFVIASVYSILHYHTNAVAIAALSLLGVIAYDVICFFKQKTEVKDFGPEMAKIQAAHVELATKVQEIRDDSSIGKLAETFKRNR